MASKDKQELRAFERAKEIRETLIRRLIKCSSEAELAKITSGYQANKAKGLFAFPTLTAYHSAIINGLNFDIQDLFNDKQKQFGPKKDAAVKADAVVEHQGVSAVLVEQQETAASVAKPGADSASMQDKVAAVVTEEHQSASAVVVEPAADKHEAAAVGKDQMAATVVGQHDVTNDDTHETAQDAVVVASPKKAKKVHFNDVVSYHHAGKMSSGVDLHLDPCPPINLARERHLADVRAQIKLLREKAQYFANEFLNTKDKKYMKALTSALILANRAEALTDAYVTNRIDLPAYKLQAKKLFSEKNVHVKELNTHRGWKEILVNVLAAMVGTVFFLAAAAYKGTFYPIKPTTDAAKKVNGLSNAIDKVEGSDLEHELNLNQICKC